MNSIYCRTLRDAPLDIVGDVHGELDALEALIHKLGYGPDGKHPEGRRLVFVGDLCDRGPDSPGVIELVRRIVEEGHGDAVLGNHELNLLKADRKESNNWFWDDQNDGNARRDKKFEPYRRLAPELKQQVLGFFESLPIALHRDDIRVVHAAWHAPSLEKLQRMPPLSLMQNFATLDAAVSSALQDASLEASVSSEAQRWKPHLHDSRVAVPLLEAMGKRDELRQMGNPIRVLTSGQERLSTESFFSSGKWRFVERVKWWDEYEDRVPVVMGHYWRKWEAGDHRHLGKGNPDLFEGIGRTHWHGQRSNVFCVDFSVGARFSERMNGLTHSYAGRLAALRWPERLLVLDSGESFTTEGFDAGP